MKKISVLILVLFSFIFSAQKTIIKIKSIIEGKNSPTQINTEIKIEGDEEVKKGLLVNSKVFINDSLVHEASINDKPKVANDKSKTKKVSFSQENYKDDLVFVEGGTFMMGSSDNEAYCNEKPVHRVRISSFYMESMR